MTLSQTLALAALLSVAGCTGLGVAPTDGPLLARATTGMGVVHVAVGEPFSDTFEVLLNEGDKPVRITSVEFLDTPGQLQLVEALIGVGRTDHLAEVTVCTVDFFVEDGTCLMEEE